MVTNVVAATKIRKRAKTGREKQAVLIFFHNVMYGMRDLCTPFRY